MAVGAILALFVAILVGTLVLAELPADARVRRLAGGHVSLALVATVTVAVAAFTSDSSVAWVGGVAVLAAVSVGLLTWRRSLTVPAHAPASPALLIIHGTAAALGLVLIVAFAARG